LQQRNRAEGLHPPNLAGGASGDASGLVDRIVGETLHVVSCLGACAVLLDRGGKKPERVAVAGEFPRPDARGLEAAIESQEFRKAREAEGVVLDQSGELWRQLGLVRALGPATENLAIVRICRHEVVGFLLVMGKKCRRGLAPDALKALLAVASQAAVALDDARLLEDVIHARNRQRELLWQLINVQEE
jgi:hypothetical protein